MKNFSKFLLLAVVILAVIPEIYGKIDITKVAGLYPCSQCLLALSQKFFVNKKVLAKSLLVINTFQTPKTLVQRKVLTMFNEDENHELSVMVKTAKKPHMNSTRQNSQAQNYLLLYAEMSDIEANLKQWKSLPSWNPLALTVVFVMDPFNTTDYRSRTVKEIFDKLRQHGHINANTIYQMADNDYKMEVKSWFPYYNQSCYTKVDNIYKICECSVPKPDEKDADFIKTGIKIVDFNQEKYPKLPKKLNNCELNASAFLWEPFVVGDTMAEAGLEYQMLQTIAQQMKLKLNISILPDDLAIKKITNDTVTGIYASLLQEKAEVMVGGLSENSISRKLVSSSIPYYQDDITWCVSKSGLASTWLNCFIVFNKLTWTILVLTFVVASFFLLHFVRIEGVQRQNFAWSTITTVAVSIGQYGHYWPAKTAIRIFIGTMLFFGLHINTAYHSSLLKVLTHPRQEEQISTVEKAIAAGIEFKVGENNVEFFKKNDSVSKYLLSHHKICNDMDQCFKEIVKNKSKALAISRTYAQHNPFRFNDNDDFYCFSESENVVTYAATMMFRRYHHLLATFNEKIRAITESGLLAKWQADSKALGKITLVKKDGGGHGSTQMKLRLHHVGGAFLVVAIGLSIALLVFLLELLTRKLAKNRNSCRFIRQLESYLCHAKTS